MRLQYGRSSIRSGNDWNAHLCVAAPRLRGAGVGHHVLSLSCLPFWSMEIDACTAVCTILIFAATDKGLEGRATFCCNSSDCSFHSWSLHFVIFQHHWRQLFRRVFFTPSSAALQCASVQVVQALKVPLRLPDVLDPKTWVYVANFGLPFR